MKRRDFMAASCLAGLAPLGSVAMAQNADTKKQYYELRLYELASPAKQEAFIEFLGKAAIPAMNRLGIEPVGVFKIIESDTPSPNLYVLMPHKSLESAATANRRMMADDAFIKAGAAVLDAPKSDPGYKRIVSSLMVAFDGIPQLEIPSKKASRVFQLRTYESHNATKAVKKVAMFNEGGEIDIFRRTGLPPVFFGETLIGPQMPNLTYMLGFDDMAAKEAGWAKFLADPAWTKLKTDPQYKDTVSGITNIMLSPAACSQI
ncbi:MAG: NIPSNAP family protein [Candidatus Nealsonbacteria bacterium]|nr:NIPSNAP family protein [Candidatus Nealsonbacteria bacterium]